MLEKFDYRLNDISTIEDVLLVSNKVFLPSDKEVFKYHDKHDWLSKIQNGGLLISVYEDTKCVGFAICYKVDKEELHIWNVGLLDEYRGKGIWKETYKIIVEYSLEKNFKKLTLNTYKDKFPNMYTFVNKEGFRLLKEEETPSGCIKSFFVKKFA